MNEKIKKQKVKRFKAGAELARMVQVLHKKHPDNDLYEVLQDALKLPQQEQHELWLVVNAVVTERKKIKRFKAGAELASTATGAKTKVKGKKVPKVKAGAELGKPVNKARVAAPTKSTTEKKVKKFKPGAELALTKSGK